MGGTLIWSHPHCGCEFWEQLGYDGMMYGEFQECIQHDKKMNIPIHLSDPYEAAEKMVEDFGPGRLALYAAQAVFFKDLHSREMKITAHLARGLEQIQELNRSLERRIRELNATIVAKDAILDEVPGTIYDNILEQMPIPKEWSSEEWVALRDIKEEYYHGSEDDTGEDPE
jgi:hypothetical protein